MSSYVDNNLMPNETTIKKGSIHWFTYVPGALLFLIGLISILGSGGVFGLLFLAFGILFLTKSFLYHISTELAVTSKRVVAKFGFIRRNTIELNHKNVESFKVEQTIFGRLFNFGTVFINGTGGVSTPIPHIVAPLDFRKEALVAIEHENA
ncbi:MAG: PH domain-containing protein [gamma proteobacterium symbiont of Lucinoma myriamae]|nr:PH domain-containing protein [gamma proteobacterium symbiont of Lucinoma myriamae]MCU7817924.1 PH domain-containing protein [gamma proteobacterium symbiont of Lucinoma myriamae]